MKQEGSLEVFRYVQFVLVVVVLKVFVCLHLVAMQLTATSQIDPLVIALSLPKPAIALAAIFEDLSLVNLHLDSSPMCERKQKIKNICSQFGYFFSFYFYFYFLSIIYLSVFIKFHYLLSQQHHLH